MYPPYFPPERKIYRMAVGDVGDRSPSDKDRDLINAHPPDFAGIKKEEKIGAGVLT
jgi:hypothetical protein